MIIEIPAEVAEKINNENGQLLIRHFTDSPDSEQQPCNVQLVWNPADGTNFTHSAIGSGVDWDSAFGELMDEFDA